jgi:hypothetical protein
LAGYLCQNPGTIDPTLSDKCPSGSYCPSEGIITPCEEGFYCPTEGLGAPLACPPGFYSDIQSSQICVICPPGVFCSDVTGPIFVDPTSVSTYDCPEGYFCPEGTTHASQHPCPVGKYGDITKASVSNTHSRYFYTYFGYLIQIFHIFAHHLFDFLPILCLFLRIIFLSGVFT